MLNELKNLCLIDGVSGDEGRVREYIISKGGQVLFNEQVTDL